MARATEYTPGALDVDEREREVREAAAQAYITQAAAARQRKREYWPLLGNFVKRTSTEIIAQLTLNLSGM